MTVLNGLTVNGTLSLERSANSSSSSSHVGLDFAGGDQTLAGTGEVVFNGQYFGGPVPLGWQWMQPTNGSQLTVGPDLTVRTGASSGRVGNSSFALVTQGILRATNGLTLQVTGSSVDNQGSLQADDGILDVDGLTGSLGVASTINGSSSLPL